MTDFKSFARIVRNKLDEWMNDDVRILTTVSDKDIFRDVYLPSFPDGTNPKFLTNTEHDCNCCKTFLRHMGHSVYIDDNNQVRSLWGELEGLEGTYAIVTQALNDFIINETRLDTILYKEMPSYGVEENTAEKEGEIINFNHFNVKLGHSYHGSDYVSKISGFREMISLGKRTLGVVIHHAITDVIDLIDSDSIYRGAEHRNALVSFQKFYTEYSYLNSEESRNNFIYRNMTVPISRFKNSVIGTLVYDLSNGVNVEDAVRMFESKVAPSNYKRSKSLITPKMVAEAQSTLKINNLEDAIHRRHAKVSDVSVNNVLFVDRNVRKNMKDSGELMDILKNDIKTESPSMDNAKDINIEAFIQEVLPKVVSMNALVSSDHMNRFVTLTTSDADQGLFKWGNNFGWSYDGDVTDSIKQRVKNAGGKVDGHLRVSLSWFNTDDLDISVVLPSMGTVDFRNTMGILDVDMNVRNPVRNAVENLTWDEYRIEDGKYHIRVDNYRRRESIDTGFELEVECEGVVRNYSYDNVVRGKNTYLVLTMKSGSIMNIETSNGLSESRIAQEKWGLNTGSMVPVSTIMLSPNHWDDKSIGNKHYMFYLDGCKNPDPVRGFYNEYLRDDLHKHRKVFEILGSKMMSPFQEEQLSGLGFSSTQKGSLKLQVTLDNGTKRNYNVVIKE